MRISRLIVSAAAGAAVTLASGAQGAEGPIASIETEYLGEAQSRDRPGTDDRTAHCLSGYELLVSRA